MHDIITPDLTGIEWLPCSGIDLNYFNLSVPERLEKFGYAVILDRSAASKIDKAELCVYDILMKSENPRLNMVIFCPPHLMQNWYSALLQDLGVEFKFINFDEKLISFYSESCSNLYIADSSQLYKASECKTVREFRQSGMVWDLMIINLPFSADETDINIFINELRNKTQKIIICAASPDCGDILEPVKNLLYNKEQAEAVSRYPIDVSILNYNPYYPILKDDGQETNTYKVNTLYYSIDQTLTPQSKRIDDIQTGIPMYVHGGNVFEEYSLEERKIYLHSDYSKDDLNVLCSVDKKLEIFLNEMKKAIPYDNDNRGNTIIVYAVCESTINYLHKVLTAVFCGTAEIIPDNSAEFPLSSDNPRIIIANDNTAWRFNTASEITHIFNYEYPGNPDVLQTRCMRRGRNGNHSPVFYIFTDTDYRFDGRILRKTVLCNLHLAFNKRVPSKNILMYAEDIDRHLTALLIDLKFINQYTKEVGSSFDTVTRFRTEFNIAGGGNVTTAAKAHEKTGKMLKILTDMLNLTELSTGKPTDERALYEAIVEKVSVMRSCYAYLDENGRLRFINKNNTAPDSPEENRFVKGVKQAEAVAVNFSEDVLPHLKNQINGLPDATKTPVLFSCLKHCKGKSHAELMRMYNRGI